MVIDASVQVALLTATDPNHEPSMAWYRRALVADVPLSAPWILVAEVAAALARGLDDTALAQRAVEQVLEGGALRLVDVDEALARRAAEIAANHRIRGCDAVYVALAESLATPLITLDRQQLHRAASLVDVRAPTDA